MAKQKVTVEYGGDKSFLDKVNALLDKQLRLVGATEDEVKDLGKAYRKVGDGAKAGVGKAKKELQGLDGVAKKVRNTVVAVFAVSKIVQAGKAVINTRAEFQKFGAVLQNTLGSKSGAQEALTNIQKFASETPFSVSQLTDSFVKLANQGFIPTTTEMRQLGDLASSTGKDFDQLAEAVIDAQVGEFERLKEFGVKASKQGDQVAFTFKGVTQTVENTNDAIKNYVTSLGDATGVAGSMNAISQTLGGQISNMGDNMDDLANVVGERLEGAISGAISAVSGLIGWFADLLRVPLSEKIEEDRITMLALNEVIVDTTASTEDRQSAINEVVRSYPEYFSGMNTEIGNYEQIEQRIMAVNKVLLAKRDLQLADEILAEAQEDRDEASKNNLRATLKANALIIDAKKNQALAQEIGNKKGREALDVIRNSENATYQQVFAAEALAIATGWTKTNLEEANKELDTAKESTAEIKNNIDPEALAIEKSFGQIESTFNRIKGDASFIDVDELEGAKQKALESIKSIDNFGKVSAQNQEEITERLNERFAELVPIVEAKGKQASDAIAKSGQKAVDKLIKSLEKLRDKLADLKFDEQLELVGGADSEAGIELLRERALKEMKAQEGFNSLKLEEQKEFERLVNAEFAKAQRERIQIQMEAEGEALKGIRDNKDKQIQANLDIINEQHSILKLERTKMLAEDLEQAGDDAVKVGEIKAKFEQESLDEEIRLQEEKIMAIKALGGDAVAEEQKLAELRLKNQQEMSDKAIEIAKFEEEFKAEQMQKNLELAKEVGMELFELFRTDKDLRLETELSMAEKELKASQDRGEATVQQEKRVLTAKKKIAEQERKIKVQQFLADKANALATIAINLSKEISGISVATAPIPPPVGPALRTSGIVQAKIRAGIGAGLILAQTLSGVKKLKDGEIDINGPGTGTSDSIPALLSKGESVMTASETKQFKPFLKGIREKSVDPEFLNMLPQLGGSAQGKLNEAMLAVAIRKELQEHGAFNKFSFDSNGFTRSVVEGQSETIYLDSIYD